MSFGPLKLYLYGGVALIIILGLSFSHYKAYSLGSSVTETKYVKQLSDINEKTAELLNQQIEEHNKFVIIQKEKITALEAENERLSKIKKENASEASKDPDAKRPAVSKSGVVRLNGIK